MDRNARTISIRHCQRSCCIHIDVISIAVLSLVGQILIPEPERDGAEGKDLLPDKQKSRSTQGGTLPLEHQKESFTDSCKYSWLRSFQYKN